MKSFLANAKRLRSNMTLHEHIMWLHVRAGRLSAYKFKRQQPIGRYIVDFVCLEAKLVIELDGGQHMDAKLADEARDVWLIAQGYTVLRFWNHELTENLEGVLQTILTKLNAHHPLAYSHPLPNPSPLKGEGQ